MSGIRKRRVELTTEIYEKITIRRTSGSNVFCKICQCTVQAFSPSILIQNINSASAEKDQELIEGVIHFAGDTDMICGNSLENHFENNS